MRFRTASALLLCALVAPLVFAAAQQGGDMGVPLPLFPADNWWNVNVSSAPVDPGSAGYIGSIGPSRSMHPDFGGYSGEPDGIYGMPYAVVDGDTQTKMAVLLRYSEESDGVDHDTDQSYPFYPIPDEAKTEPYWIEAGPPGNVSMPDFDRHMLIVDRDNNYLYELYNLLWTGSQWTAVSGAFFDMNTNNRRPEGWTSADAAGLAVLPGLVRYEEVYGPDPIRHAFRFTVRSTNGHVYPASHSAGSTGGALPMGARLRLKASVDLAAITSDVHVRKIFEAMKTYGLILADNGSDLYVQGTFNPNWDNDILNPAFGRVHGSDFEVIQLGWTPPPQATLSVEPAETPEGDTGTGTMTFDVTRTN
jgi:hypothetical protein